MRRSGLRAKSSRQFFFERDEERLVKGAFAFRNKGATLFSRRRFARATNHSERRRSQLFPENSKRETFAGFRDREELGRVGVGPERAERDLPTTGASKNSVTV